MKELDKLLIGCDDLREWLISQGFYVVHTSMHGALNECNWYGYRKTTLPARSCEHNNNTRMLLVAYPYKFSTPSVPDSVWESVEVEVAGEARGVWFKLQAYSLKSDELRARLEEIESCLIAAWNALHSNDVGVITLPQQGELS